MIKKDPDIYTFQNTSNFKTNNLPSFSKIQKLFLDTIPPLVQTTKWLEINGYRVQCGSIIIFLREISEFYFIEKIILREKSHFQMIAKKLLNVFLRGHSQSFVANNINDDFEWHILNYNDFVNFRAVKSVKNKDNNGFIHITKKWM